MNLSKKIGLAGRSGSGKDLIADYIGDRLAYRKIAVADGIRIESDEFLREALSYLGGVRGLPDTFDVVLDAFAKAVYDKPTSPEMRVLLQWWGTEFRRNQNPDYWVTKLAERLDNDDRIVVSDVRTPDEAVMIRNYGGEVWFVERPGVGPVGISNHHTEVALDGMEFDQYIHNDGTIEDLYAKVWNLCQRKSL